MPNVVRNTPTVRARRGGGGGRQRARSFAPARDAHANRGREVQTAALGTLVARAHPPRFLLAVAHRRRRRAAAS